MTLHPKCTLLRKNELIVGRWIWCRAVSTECAVWSVHCTLELDVETCNIWALELLLTALPTLCSAGSAGQPASPPKHIAVLYFSVLQLSLPKPLFLSLPNQATPYIRDQHAAGLPTTIELFFQTWRGVLRILHNFRRCSQTRSANGRNNDTVERHRLFCFVREARSTYWPCRFALSLWHLNTLASPTVTV